MRNCALRTRHNASIHVEWIKTHVGIIGYEIADRTARTGTRLREKLNIEVSIAESKQKVTESMYTEWDKRWQSMPSCKQTKLFMPEVNRAKSKNILMLKKSDLRTLFRNITVHAHLARHNNIYSREAITRSNGL